MSDALAVITRVIAEHQTIREHIRLAGDALNDIEAKFALQKLYSGWTQSSIEELAKKQEQLQQVISSLAEGLKEHFAFEEKALPPLFGELLMKALLAEHHDIAGQIEKVKTMLAGTNLKGLERRELLGKKSEMQNAVSRISQVVEEHAGHEDIILHMIKRALESA